MLGGIIRKKFSGTYRYFANNPIQAIFFQAVSALYALPSMRQFFVSESIYNFLVFGTYFTIIATVIFYFSRKEYGKYEKAKYPKEGGSLPILGAQEQPSWLSSAFFGSAILLFFSTVFSLFADCFSISYQILGIIIKGNPPIILLSLIASALVTWVIVRIALQPSLK